MRYITPEDATKNEYDVVIVGGGISGALVAKSLSQNGKRCLIVEAGTGEGMSPQGYRGFLKTFYENPIKIPNSPYPPNPNAPEPLVTDAEQITPENTPDTKGYFVQYGPLPFRSSYTTYLGGTTLHWLGTCLRMLPQDFSVKTEFGVGVDWPINYSDLEPWYCMAERELGVSAEVDEQRYLGVAFPEDYVYPMHTIPKSYSDKLLGEKVDGTVIEEEGVEYRVQVRGTPAARNSIPNKDYDNGKGYIPRGAVGDPAIGKRCMGNTSCVPICPIQAKYTALKTLDQVKEGLVDITTKSVASKLEIDPKTKQVTGIMIKHYQDPNDPAHKEYTLTGKRYVLAAHAVANAVLLQASDACTTSGMVGRNLMDHPELLTWGLADEAFWPLRGPLSTSGIEDLRGGQFRSNRAAFRMEIGNDGWLWPTGAPTSDVEDMVDNQNLFGPHLRQALLDQVSRQFRFGCLVEQLPDENNTVTIDPNYKDDMGNYRPIIHYDLTDYTRAGFQKAKEVCDRLFQKASVTSHSSYPKTDPGYFEYKGKGYVFNGAGHFAGTHRMGDDPKTSVVNPKQRAWDHDNLYLVGCGNMVTMGTSNPTLTMSALALWAAQNILDDLNGGA